MGRVIHTTLDGGMVGSRGQYRLSEDNQVLSSENLLQERDGTMRNRPPVERILPAHIGLLETDKVTPFNWRGKRMFLVYDPLYEFRWKVFADWVSRVGETVQSPSSNMAYVTIGGSKFDCRHLITNLRFLDKNVGMDAGVTLRLQDAITGSVLGPVIRDSDGGRTGLINLLVRRFDSRHVPGESSRNRPGTAYMGFYLLSLMGHMRMPFFIHDRVASLQAASHTANVNYVRPLRPYMNNVGEYWHRFFIMDEKGVIRCNGVTRAMPLSYEPVYSSTRSRGNETEFLRQFYTGNPVTDIRNKMEYRGKSCYVLSEGVNNNIAYDPEGLMPPLVIEGDESGTILSLSELNTKYNRTGLTRRFYPSWLTLAEQNRDIVWDGNYDAFDTFFPDNLKYVNGTRDVPGSNAGVRADDINPRTNLYTNDDLDSMNTAFSKKTGDDSVVYREKTVFAFEPPTVPDYQDPGHPVNTGISNSLPLRLSSDTENTVSSEYLAIKDVSVVAAGLPSGVCRLRYAYQSDREALTEYAWAVQANPFFEQNPVVAYRNNIHVRERTEDVRFRTVHALREADSTSPGSSNTVLRSGWFYANPYCSLMLLIKKGETRQTISITYIPEATLGTGVTGWTYYPSASNIISEGASELRDNSLFGTLPNSVDKKISSDVLREREYYKYSNWEVAGFTPGNYFRSVSASTNRYVFSEVEGLRHVLMVTDTTSLPTIEGIARRYGPDVGGFGFSSFDRLNRSKDISLRDMGYVQPLTETGGLEVYWLRSFPELPQTNFIVGLNQGKLYVPGASLEQFQMASFDRSDRPSQIPPVVVSSILYQVMADLKSVYAIEYNERGQRRTWRSVTAPIGDEFLDDTIKWIGGLADTLRLLVLTAKGRLFCGLLDTEGFPAWTELSVGGKEGIDEVHRVDDTLYVLQAGAFYELALEGRGDIEDGSALSLTLKHPAAYAVGKADKALSSFSNPKYYNGRLLGVFKSGDSPEEVRIGTHEAPGTLSAPRSVFDVEFGSVNPQSMNDGLRFDFAARRIEIDAVHMEIKN